VVERPTWAAALKASFVLQGFVLDLDDQFACEMCAVLAKFGLFFFLNKDIFLWRLYDRLTGDMKDPQQT